MPVKTEHEEFLRLAIRLARSAFELNVGRPFGAVVVKGGKIVATAQNEVIARTDMTAHAEILALGRASKALGHLLLTDCDLYTSGFPCPMCLSAIYRTGIRKVYYANSGEDAAAFGFDDRDLFAELSKPIDERRLPMEHIRSLRQEGKKCFADWKEGQERL